MKRLSRCGASGCTCIEPWTDGQGNTVEFFLSRARGIAAAKAFFRKALKHHREPHSITLDGHRPSHSALRILEEVAHGNERGVQLPGAEPGELVARMVELATQYGRYGYRRIPAMLHGEGWEVNHKRVERLWRQEGLKVPSRQPKRRRLWLNDGSCVRLRAAHKDHVWSYDFMHERTHDGRAFRLLTILDEYTRECLDIEVKRQMNHQDVLDRLTELFVHRGVPEFIRSDNGSEFTAQAVRDWLEALGVRFVGRMDMWRAVNT